MSLTSTVARPTGPGADLRPPGDEATDDQPLWATTFVVIDLETTGASPATDRITEIGAVKVCGGVVVGELATLVDPRRPIPPDIRRLTGITDAAVGTAPPLAAVLPSLLEFVAGSVVVAHNAPFDLGFLHAGAAATGRDWAASVVLDTVRLARSVLAGGRSPTADSARWRPTSVRRRRRCTGRWPTPGRPSTSCTPCSSGSAAGGC